jgi:hypothetical protein
MADTDRRLEWTDRLRLAVSSEARATLFAEACGWSEITPIEAAYIIPAARVAFFKSADQVLPEEQLHALRAYEAAVRVDHSTVQPADAERFLDIEVCSTTDKLKVAARAALIAILDLESPAGFVSTERLYQSLSLAGHEDEAQRNILFDIDPDLYQPKPRVSAAAAASQQASSLSKKSIFAGLPKDQRSPRVSCLTKALRGEIIPSNETVTSYEPVAPTESITSYEPVTPTESITLSFAAKSWTIGQLVQGKGIYMGEWEPKERKGKTIGKRFNVFAAPTDLDPPDPYGGSCRTYINAAREVGERRDWHGHDGIHLKSDAALYAALESGSAIGKWFIPPLKLLAGQNDAGEIVQAENLYNLQDEGDFKGTFTTTENAPYPMLPRWYWSCTKNSPPSTQLATIRFSDGAGARNGKDFVRLSCRPVRVELVP